MESILKTFWIHTVRTYIAIGLFFYYKKITVVKEGDIPKNKPILFVSNHQNGLIDPLLIATTSGRMSYFLTRASAFKIPLVSKLLHSVNMLPIYRVRDGRETISKNTSIFKTCTKKLKNNHTITLFPEGNHHINRTVRPLSRGFTRIIFETLDRYPDLDLQLVPIGLNYLEGSTFGDCVSLYYSAPISTKSMVSDFSSDGVIALRKTVRSQIMGLTTHIDSAVYEDSIMKLNALGVDFLNPKAVNTCIKSNFQTCVKVPKQTKSIIKKFFMGLLIINLFLPYVVWKYYIKRKIDEIEFIATFRFTLAITLVPFWILILCLIFVFNFGVIYGLSYLIIVLVVALLSVKL